MLQDPTEIVTVHDGQVFAFGIVWFFAEMERIVRSLYRINKPLKIFRNNNYAMVMFAITNNGPVVKHVLLKLFQRFSTIVLEKDE